MKKSLIGYGGHAREVMTQMSQILPCFVDDEFVTKNTSPISEFDPTEFRVMIAIGDSAAREKIVKNLPKETKFFTFIHPTALIGESVEIGEGTFIGAYSILTTNIKIGKHSLLNRANHIGHDSIIGDYFTMMPGSIISGNCNIGDRVYFGTNSSVRQKINICSDVTIGLNSGVVKDITEAGIYGGVPTKLLKKI